MAKVLRKILSDDEIFNDVVRTCFDEVDCDRSGFIDAQELKKIIINMAVDLGSNPPTEEEADIIMQYYDTDKSGMIEFNEFSELIRKILETMIGE